MKPVSAKQLRNSLSIAIVFARMVSMLQHIERKNPRSAWKTSTPWPTSVSQSWPKGIRVSGGWEKQRQT